ncbi:hypothetical protein SHKM778_36050 [Streptomyces sp. KM77-8]|uniref:Uncharacterized protein n=1 Tax=Streptomyces haneummycinicus TaxID=3074435 RepID=A0AAT9HIW0_9ACTN
MRDIAQLRARAGSDRALKEAVSALGMDVAPPEGWESGSGWTTCPSLFPATRVIGSSRSEAAPGVRRDPQP